MKNQTNPPLKRKVYEIKKDIELLIGRMCIEKYWVNCYGANNLNSKYLVFFGSV